MIIAIISTALALSIILNVVLVWYTRIILTKIYAAAEAASGIFTRLDAYRSHIKTIYELEMFYGDKNLKEVVDHTRDLLDFLKKYEAIYSFTQPELEEILKEEDETADDDESQKEVQKIFHKSSREGNNPVHKHD